MGMPANLPIVDLGVGFPYTSLEQKLKAYAFMRPLFRDKETLKSFEFPAQYMFKDVPDVIPEDQDPVDYTVAEMDKWGIAKAVVGLGPTGIEAARRYPGRFFFSFEIDPNGVMDTVREIRRAHAEHGIKSVGCFPCGAMPQVPIDDPKMYPVYACCVDLGLPICINAGVVGPRMPTLAQDVKLLDQVCYDFPELTIVTRHGCEPWQALAVKLMLKWPGLHYMTSAFAPKHYPQEIVQFANTRGADKIMYCGYFPAGISIERQMTEMPKVPFRDHVWPRFLHQNAERVFGLDA